MASNNHQPFDFHQKKSPEVNNLDFVKKIIIFLSLLVYIIIFPPFLKNLALAGHDAGAHLTYLRIFADALSQGQFPVRWIEWVQGGQNQPLFSFYQPLLYYLGQIPHILGSDILNSLYQTVIFLWLFSGFITFLFVRNITKNTLAGLTASLLYVFAPYHILDVFVRTAYPEVTALAFAPGLFWAVERYFATGKRLYLGFLALFFAAVFTSHPPTLLMFAFPFGLYFCFLLWKAYKKHPDLLTLVKNAVFTCFGLGLGFGLACFFALPAFLQQNLVNSSSLQAGYLDFHTHFACLLQLVWSNWGFGTSIAGCGDQLSFQVGIVNWIVIVAAITILIYYFRNKLSHQSNLLVIMFLFIAFFGMYMTLSYSQPFWEGLPYFAFLQFPWRFLSVVIFAVAVLGGLLFTYLNKESHKIILFIAFLIVTPVLVYSYLVPPTYLPKDYFAQDSPAFYQGLAQGQQGTAELGYMPKYAAVLPEPQNVPPSEIAVSDPNAQVQVIKNTFTDKEYQVNTTEDSEVQLFIHYFPGWKFYINGKEVTPDYNNIYGFSYLEADAGQNRIVAEFTNTPIVTLGNTITLLSIIVLLVLMLTSKGLPTFTSIGKIDVTQAP